MPDTTTTTTPEPKKARRHFAALSQRQVRELDKAEQIGLAAQKEEHAAKLLAREITALQVAALIGAIKDCRETAATALRRTTAKEADTRSEKHAQQVLLRALVAIQDAAKQKYARTTPRCLQNYYIGKRLEGNRAALVQYAQGIIDQLALDTLPGVTPEQAAALPGVLEAYQDANTSQSDNQSAATSERIARDAQVRKITDQRITIQLAANAEWPHTDPANIPIRREFHLPEHRRFVAISPDEQPVPPPVP